MPKFHDSASHRELKAVLLSNDSIIIQDVEKYRPLGWLYAIIRRRYRIEISVEGC